MGKLDALAAVSKLANAFQREMTPEAVAAYAENLEDLPAWLLVDAVSQVIKTAKFFPAIAEIRNCALRIGGLDNPTPAEAMAIVRRADVRRTVFRRDGTPAYVEREWVWPEDVEPRVLDVVQDALAKVGEPAGADDKEYFGWEMGFQKTYEVAAESATRIALADLSKALPPVERKRLTE